MRTRSIVSWRDITRISRIVWATVHEASHVTALQVVLPRTFLADEIVREYMSDVASRWYGRQATPDEVEEALHGEPYEDLQGASGVFLAAVEDGRAVGCAGVRFGDEFGELTKVFTRPDHRGQGLGGRLLEAAERACVERGIATLRLDTRAALREACALYERNGFERVAAFNNEPYSDRWYMKVLDLNAR